MQGVVHQCGHLGVPWSHQSAFLRCRSGHISRPGHKHGPGRTAMKLLHIDSSVLGEASASRELSAAIVKALTGAMPDVEVIRRDLDADPIPHLDSRLLAAVRPDIAVASATRATDEKGAAASKSSWAQISSSSGRR